MLSKPTGGRTRGARAFAQIGLGAALALFVLCAGVILWGSAGARGTHGEPSAAADVAVPGTTAQSFRLPDLDSRLVGLDDLRGRVVLLCITSPERCSTTVLPGLGEIVRPYQNEPRVQSITVLRTDSPPGSPEVNRLRMDFAAAGFRWPTLLDVSSDVTREYRAAHGTSLFVIDAAGIIRHRADAVEQRPEAFADARRAVERLLHPQVAVVAAARPAK